LNNYSEINHEILLGRVAGSVGLVRLLWGFLALCTAGEEKPVYFVAGDPRNHASRSRIGQPIQI